MENKDLEWTEQERAEFATLLRQSAPPSELERRVIGRLAIGSGPVRRWVRGSASCLASGCCSPGTGPLALPARRRGSGGRPCCPPRWRAGWVNQRMGRSIAALAQASRVIVFEALVQLPWREPMTDQVEVHRSDWSWLQGTYWYVQPGNLPALQLDPDPNILTWVIDQTVWHIAGYRDGYFWGTSATLIRKQQEEATQTVSGAPVCFTMLGSITPEGRVYLAFTQCNQKAVGSPTIGIGRAVRHRNDWSMEMQMSSGASQQTAHWAYMTRVQPDDPNWESLPGAGLSVPEMLRGCEPPQLNGNTA